MKQEPHYVLEGDAYAFYLQGGLAFKAPEVSVLVDRAQKVLLRHGAPATVAKALYECRKAFGRSEELAANLAVVTGKFEIEELNKLVVDPTYAGKFYDRVMAQLELTAAREADTLLSRIRRNARKSASKP